MRLKVTRIEDGIGPGEVIVSVNARDRIHYVVLDELTIDEANTIDVGYPVGRSGEHFLVALPGEADDGSWRLWVNRDSLVEVMAEAAE